jgi:excinuclease UvrABC nuclease subunit
MQAMPSAQRLGENPTLRERISQFPKTAGASIYKGRPGRVLYVGKAKDLRSRVAS